MVMVSRSASIKCSANTRGLMDRVPVKIRRFVLSTKESRSFTLEVPSCSQGRVMPWAETVEIEKVPRNTKLTAFRDGRTW